MVWPRTRKPQPRK